jgi:hypothetical protein
VLKVFLVLVVGLFFNVIKGVYFETIHMWLSEGVGGVFGVLNILIRFIMLIIKHCCVTSFCFLDFWLIVYCT